MTLRITQKRQQILDVLKNQRDTLSAAQIHAKLPQIDLVTIYRSLDLFMKEKLIRQIHLGADEALYEYQHEPHHHAVCIECEKVIHFTAPDTKIKKLLGLEDFQVDEIEVTVRGICAHKNNKASN
ncbi:MAG: Fur family peroxide stress response transcriptional regulator [Acidimicrobiales bacterium]|jgi:Fur family peroxide stress response transcriptional regulator